MLVYVRGEIEIEEPVGKRLPLEFATARKSYEMR